MSLAFCASSRRRSVCSRCWWSLRPMGVTSGTGALRRDRSVEQVRLVADDLVVERLEADPPRKLPTHLVVRLPCALLVDEDGVAGGLGHQLHVAGALHGDVP